MELASPSTRLFGQCIDAVIGFLPMALVAVAELFGRAASIVGGSGLVLCLGYFLLADALPGGQSVGKRILRTAVVDAETGAPCRVWQSLVRNLLLIVLGPIDWVFIFGSRHQRFGDLIARTVVVQET